jgi:hypothetical protein
VSEARPVPPPLGESGLRLHRDGNFTHEGQPIRHARLRAVLERGVRYAESEARFVVQLGRYRAGIEVEGTAFFVRGFDAREGSIALSDGSCESLAVASLCADADGALLCTVKQRFAARFTHAAQAELLAHVEAQGDGAVLRAAGRAIPLPAGLL